MPMLGRSELFIILLIVGIPVSLLAIGFILLRKRVRLVSADGQNVLSVPK